MDGTQRDNTGRSGARRGHVWHSGAWRSGAWRGGVWLALLSCTPGAAPTAGEVLRSGSLRHRGAAAFEPGRVLISEQDQHYTHQVHLADLDGDGHADVLSSARSPNDGGIVWHRNAGDGTLEPAQIITSDDVSGAWAADLDGDGDLDVIDNRGGWHESAGDGTFTPRQLTGDWLAAETIEAGDLDGDGDLEVLYSEYWAPAVYWYDNLGDGTFGPRREVPTPMDPELRGQAAALADLDDDGELDVLSSVEGDHLRDGLSWARNLGGTFGPAQLLGSRSSSVDATDLDGDGDLDVLADLRWHEGAGDGTFGPAQLVSTDPWPLTTRAADLDGDGDGDVISSGSDQEVAWYEHTAAGFGPRRPLSEVLLGTTHVTLGDLDGDGCTDVLAATTGNVGLKQGETSLIWYRNAMPCHDPPQPIDTSPPDTGTPPPTDTGPPPGEPPTGDTATSTPDPGPEGGCGCRQGPPGASVWALALLLGWRRRARAQRTTPIRPSTTASDSAVPCGTPRARTLARGTSTSVSIARRMGRAPRLGR